MRHPHYERDDETFSADAYAISGYEGIAWAVLGWETQPDEDAEWSGYEERTGEIVCVMVGDDKRFRFDPSEITPLDEGAYCHECGQIGCTHDGR